MSDQDLIQAAKSGNVTAIRRWFWNLRRTSLTYPAKAVILQQLRGRQVEDAVNRLEIPQELAAFLKGEPKNEFGCTALILASYLGHDQAVQELLNFGANIEAKDKNGFTALTHASDKGHHQVVQTLLGFGANIEAKGSDGFTVLARASSKGHHQVVQTLLNFGANIEAKGNQGATALMAASYYGHNDIVRQLLNDNFGADIEAKTDDGATSLMIAASFGHVETVELLLKNGSDVAARDRDGKTAQQCATNHDVKRLLKEAAKKVAEK